MIDVVYPLANASKYRDDFELRYSLRSLQQQSWVRKVYLVGHCPNWAQGVIHIPCGDPYVTCKDANIINKILLACSCPEISQEFVVNSDDQYILKPIGIEDIVPMLETPNRLSEYHARAGINTWHKRVVDTVAWCKQNGYPDWVLQAHVPYIIGKAKYVKVFSQIPWGRGNGYISHIYINMAYDETPNKEPKGHAIRVKSRVDINNFPNAIKQAIFLNHNDNGLLPIVKEFLENHFPVKSRWEK